MFVKIQKLTLKIEAKILMVIMLMLLSTKLLAQKPANIILHAYSREVSGGAMQATEGNENGNKTPFQHYFIYVEAKGGSTPIITALFLLGHNYSAQIKKVQTPVEIFTSDDGQNQVKQTLVKHTGNTVHQIIVTRDNTNFPPALAIKKQSEANDVLIKGIRAGKGFTLIQTKIEKLPSVFVQ